MVSTTDELFGLDPTDFVAARDELARELRQQGDKDAAKAVKAMRRPPVPVWALNQVARDAPDAVDALIAAGAEAQSAKGETVREALAERRQRLHDVVRAARSIIECSGRSADPHELNLTSALSTILGSERLSNDFRAGHLTEVADDAAEIEWPDVSATPVPPRPSRELVKAREEVERRHAAVDDAAARVTDAQRALADAQQALARAEEDVARLEG
jgi:hypothetical protein